VKPMARAGRYTRAHRRRRSAGFTLAHVRIRSRVHRARKGDPDVADGKRERSEARAAQASTGSAGARVLERTRGVPPAPPTFRVRGGAEMWGQVCSTLHGPAKSQTEGMLLCKWGIASERSSPGMAGSALRAPLAHLCSLIEKARRFIVAGGRVSEGHGRADEAYQRTERMKP
jgi:hypothetical protein